MTWQLVTTLILVAIASGYLLRKCWQTWHGRGKNCGHGCGKIPKPESAPPLISLEVGRLRPRS